MFNRANNSPIFYGAKLFCATVIAGALSVGVTVPAATTAFASELPATAGAAQAGQASAGETNPESGPAIERAKAAQGQDIAIDAKHFPSAKWREWLKNPENLGGIGLDGVLTWDERQKVTEIYLKYAGVGDLRGIEYFPNIIHLDAEYNQLTSLDLRANTKLVNMYVRHNQLRTLLLPRPTSDKKIFIEAFDNRLTSINLSMIPNLAFVHLDYNDLVDVDLSHNTKLEGDGFVLNNNRYLRSIKLPNIPGRSFDGFVISQQDPIDGYENVSWFFDPDFKRPVDVKAHLPFDGSTLWLRRNPNAYQIRFNVGSGVVGKVPEAINTFWGQAVHLPVQVEFSRPGYEFLGWQVDGVPGLVNAENDVAVKNLAGKREYLKVATVTAVWGKLAVDEQPVLPGPLTPVVEPEPQPEKPKPQPEKPKPEPEKPKPEPVVPKPDPVVPKPDPVVPKPDPVVPKPNPEKPKPKPEPVNPKPQPEPQPKPQPKPKPDPVVPAPQPAPQPKPVNPPPKVEKPRPKCNVFADEGSSRYYYNAKCQKQTGWLQLNNHWYYFDSQGRMKTGWYLDGKTWYYSYANGQMATGWLKDGSTWYYLASWGGMRTGWVYTGGAWYYLKGSGAMATGWLYTGGAWYYLASWGGMRTGWVYTGGAWYYLKGSGAMATGWLYTGGTWYYLTGSGAMVTGWYKVGGTWYRFNGSGAWVG